MFGEQKVKRDTCSAEVIEALRKELPAVFPRSDVEKLFGNVIGKKTLTVLDHSRKGPPRHRVGRKVVYIRDQFLDWMMKFFGGYDDGNEGTGAEVCGSAGAPEGIGEAGAGD